MKPYIVWMMLFLLGMTIHSKAQQVIKGNVQGLGDKENMVGSNVYFIPGLEGTVTDAEGNFSLAVPDSAKALVVGYVGYKNDTIYDFSSKFLEIKLHYAQDLNNVSVVGERGALLQSMGAQISSTITERGLQKSACCNLSESFETSGLADVSFADGVTGAKQIRLLGLDGKYVAITAENVPALRGLANSFGLAYIPGTFIESIQVSKGPGSVSSGYESMSGAINVEYKKPWNSEKLFVNGYVNSMGRVEGNVAFSNRLPGGKWSTITQVHGSIFRVHNDRNKDGFLDIPWFRQVNGVHRWKYEKEKFEFQIGVKGLLENREGGQADYFRHGANHQGTNLYGVKINTNRFEGFMKFGFMWPTKPYKSIGIIANALYHDQFGLFGITNYYGRQRTSNVNALMQGIFDNTNHTWRAGITMMYDEIGETFRDTALFRREIVPGGWFEYNFKHLEKFSLVAGIRYDYNSVYGHFITPRLHLKYAPVEDLSIRASGGRGYRTANVFAENPSVLVSSRSMNVLEPLKAEESWNGGGGASYRFKIGGREADISADYFYTYFVNKVQVDMETPGRVDFYNLKNGAYAHAAQAEFSVKPVNGLELRVTGKYNKVMALYNGKMEQVPYVPVWRGLFNAAYDWKKHKWKFDVTVQVNGEARLPKMFDPATGSALARKSPVFPTLFAQVTKTIKRWDIYVGGENLTDFRQKNPVLGASDPYGAGFDASRVWGPIFGAMAYVGFRYKID
jgi:outer membrane receptor for ferrienterochelin and colicins